MTAMVIVRTPWFGERPLECHDSCGRASAIKARRGANDRRSAPPCSTCPTVPGTTNLIIALRHDRTSGNSWEGTGAMLGGEGEFRAMYADVAIKIDGACLLSSGARASFWACVDAWDHSSSPIAMHFASCCYKRSLEGPKVGLLPKEQLGHAHRRSALERTFSTRRPGSSVPAYLPAMAQRYLAKVLSERDEANALLAFKKYFGTLRISQVRSKGSRNRIFAFRIPTRPDRPIEASEIPDLFRRLNIPTLKPSDYVMFAYRPGRGHKVCQPTCFDAATIENLPLFVVGGHTASGLDEVVTTPPLCSSVSFPPRTVA